MKYEFHDSGHQTIATFDIETTSFDAKDGEVVAIGIATHSREEPAANIEYQCFYRTSSTDETEIIHAAIDALNEIDTTCLVSYNGIDFDLPFLQKRLELLDAESVPINLAEGDEHLDLFLPRKLRADARGDQWPGLEACLESYEYTPAKTLWRGEEVNNTRFGEKLGPEYLSALAEENNDLAETLRETIEHYLITDLEANLTLYYSDIGVDFDPVYEAQSASF